MTPGSDGQTLDGISKNKIEKLSTELTSETFQFKPSERIWIPKANGKMRPLGIPTPRDKIVQKAMSLLLNLIYEPEFSRFSHGFRPNRGCHTALTEISKWSGTQWAIEGDIKGFFDNVNHHLLANLLQKKIGDQQFIDLYWKLVKAGYVEEGVKRDSLMGVPHTLLPLSLIPFSLKGWAGEGWDGGIVSPILSNIYLHEFDLFIEGLINKHHSTAADITKKNPEYDKITRRIQYQPRPWPLYPISGPIGSKGRTERERERDKYPSITNRKEETIDEINKLRKQRRAIPSRHSNGIRLRYVRYADDWVVGMYGPFELVVKIKDCIATYLSQELELELSQDKTKITNLLKDKGQFLGYYFQIHRPKESRYTVIRKGGHIRKCKISHNRMWLLLPVDKILLKLASEGFLKNYTAGSKLITSAKTSWIFLSHPDIISRYNMLTRGLLNYYSIATNRYIFHLIVNFILRHSCAKTLARKLNLRTRSQTFTKFGHGLTSPTDPKISFYTEPHYRRLLKWPKHTSTYDPFGFLDWQLRTQNNF